MMDEASASPTVVAIDESELPDGELTIAVEYSSLNYKDAMVLTGRGGLARTFPHVPGIDLAGTVESSASPQFAVGDRVLVTGWRMGETRWGGYATKARVSAEHATRVPEGMDLFTTMTIGTAGFTAMLALDTLERFGIDLTRGPLLVTGAAGGVGSMTILLAARAGAEVVASTGRTEEQGYLVDLGAALVIDRGELADAPGKPLLSERWAAAVDAAGGATLAHILAEMSYGGAVAACGLAQSAELVTSVVPFLLRGVSLLGIDSVFCPSDRRDHIWGRLDELLQGWDARQVAVSVGLDDLPDKATEILSGRVRGRVVVDVNS